ncbi:hypothetical protein EV182_000085 [Spiromyces aspiralis]|uniref:Uncharacterized protein n=1 Tax=Spiromyces aspiralis TaxID=68401 RepID=A0ACC1HKX2_9FUNG|nr:hypothetical protein EV182_000085 [Spiromyces aspiralis]
MSVLPNVPLFSANPGRDSVSECPDVLPPIRRFSEYTWKSVSDHDSDGLVPNDTETTGVASQPTVKRPLSDFNFFCRDARKLIVETSPNYTKEEVNRELGRAWSRLDQATRKYYRDLYIRDKTRYHAEQYRPRTTVEAMSPSSLTDDGGTNKTGFPPQQQAEEARISPGSGGRGHSEPAPLHIRLAIVRVLKLLATVSNRDPSTSSLPLLSQSSAPLEVVRSSTSSSSSSSSPSAAITTTTIHNQHNNEGLLGKRRRSSTSNCSSNYYSKLPHRRH